MIKSTLAIEDMPKSLLCYWAVYLYRLNEQDDNLLSVAALVPLHGTVYHQIFELH